MVEVEAIAPVFFVKSDRQPSQRIAIAIAKMIRSLTLILLLSQEERSPIRFLDPFLRCRLEFHHAFR